MSSTASFKVRLIAAFIALTALIVASAGIAYIGSQQLAHYAERSRYAHEVLNAYLSLSNNTYQLFKQMSDAVFFADAVSGDDEKTLLDAARKDIESARRLIADEVRLFGDVELETDELRLLASIERKVDQIVRENDGVRSALGTESDEDMHRRIVALLDRRIDREFNALIDSAIAEEKREVAAADARLAQTSQTVGVASIAIVALTLPGGALVLIYLNRILLKSLSQLSAGAAAYAQGRLDFVIPRTEGQEFEQIRQRLVHMATELAESRRKLEDRSFTLEAAVAARTQELAEANAKLQSNDTARRRFFADISHELRTPLTVIRGEAEIAHRGPDKTAAEYKAGLARIIEQSAQTTRLVEDLLLIARADAGEARLEMRSVAVGALLEETVRNFQAAAQAKSVSLIESSSSPDAVVLGDRGRLRQVFSILLDNAIRYSRPSGEIRIESEVSGGSLLVSIDDAGVGIPMDDMSRVFERFYRADNVAGEIEGAGLGLPVAKAIVDSHKGAIRLQTSARGGVRATIALPVESKLKAIS